MYRMCLSVLCTLVLGAAFPAAASAALPRDGFWAMGVGDDTPVDDTTTLPAGWQTAPFDVTIAGHDDTDGLLRMDWQIDTSPIQSGASGTVVQISGDGTHTLATRAVDLVNDMSDWRVQTIQIDTSAPTNTTNAGSSAWAPTGRTVQVNATEPLDASGVDRVEWELDGVPGSSTTVPAAVPVMSDGQHVLRTRAVDAVGNTSSWQTDNIWIDTVTPSDHTAAPAGWQTAPLVVTLDGSDAHSGVDHINYVLDGTPASGADGSTLTVSADGEHELRTQVVDGAGHASAWKTHVIRIDKTAPVNQTPQGSGAWQASDYAVVPSGADGGSGLAAVEWRIDGGPVQRWPQASTISITGDGDHLLEVRAVDVAGNATSWRSERVKIDKVAPSDTTTAGPGPVASPYRPAVTGTDDRSGVLRVEWEVDGEPFSGASGSLAEIRGNGAHTLRTRVLDLAGNASPWKTHPVTVTSTDTTPPTDTSTTVGTGWHTTGPVQVTLQGHDTGTGDSAMLRMEWRTADSTIQRAAVGETIDFTEDGVHVLETRALDAENNVSAWREQTIKIDKTQPVAQTDLATLPWQRSRDVELVGADATSGVDRIEWQLGSGAIASVPVTNDRITVTMSGDGEFALSYRVFDNATQRSGWRAGTVKVDTVNPTNDTAAAPASGWLAAPYEVELEGTDDRSGIARMEWRVDGGEVQTGATATVEADGEHTLETRAVDAAGNTSAWRSETLRVDLTAPRNNTPAASSAWRKTAFTTTVAGSDGDGSGVDRVEWRLGSTGTVKTTSAVRITAEGTHTLQTRVVDEVGRASAWRSDTIRIDGTAPALSFDCPAGWQTAAAACSVAGSGGASGLAGLTVEGAAVASGSAYTIEADGVWTLTAAAVDGAGNRSQVARTVQVDRTAPQATLSCKPVDDGYQCSATGSDGGSGLAGMWYRHDGGAWKAVPAAGFEVGHGKLELEVADVAGLRARTRPMELEEPVKETSRSVPLRLATDSGNDGLLGSLDLERAGEIVKADLRPLGLGSGRYKISLTLADRHKHKVRRTRTVSLRGKGFTPRIRATLKQADGKVTTRLEIKRRSGRRWVRVVSTRATVAG
jgi:hypothetical protein